MARDMPKHLHFLAFTYNISQAQIPITNMSQKLVDPRIKAIVNLSYSTDTGVRKSSGVGECEAGSRLRWLLNPECRREAGRTDWCWCEERIYSEELERCGRRGRG